MDLIELFEEITKKAKSEDVGYMGFSKAFDKVAHSRLLWLWDPERASRMERELAFWKEEEVMWKVVFRTGDM